MIFGKVFALLVCLVFPVCVLVYCLVKKRGRAAFILGILVFFLSQVVLRIPLLNLAQSTFLYNLISLRYPILFVLLLGFSAALFENVVRYLLMRFFMKKQQNWEAGLFFGLGHGGLEAVLLVGISVAAQLFSPTTLSMEWMYGLGGFERVIAIVLQAGLSVIVWKSVVARKPLYLLLAIGIHGLIDTITGLWPQYIQVAGSPLIFEGILAVIGLSVFLYAFRLKKDWSVG